MQNSSFDILKRWCLWFESLVTAKGVIFEGTVKVEHVLDSVLSEKHLFRISHSAPASDLRPIADLLRASVGPFSVV